jgi:hypothetical protein
VLTKNKTISQDPAAMQYSFNKSRNSEKLYRYKWYDIPMTIHSFPTTTSRLLQIRSKSTDRYVAWCDQHCRHPSSETGIEYDRGYPVCRAAWQDMRAGAGLCRFRDLLRCEIILEWCRSDVVVVHILFVSSSSCTSMAYRRTWFHMQSLHKPWLLSITMCSLCV